MTDRNNERKPTRDYLNDPEAFRIANWRLHNSGDGNMKPEEEVAQAKEHGPGLLRAAGKAFEHIENEAVEEQA